MEPRLCIPRVHCKSSSPERSPQIHGPDEPLVAICVGSASFWNHGALGKVVSRPAREHEDLEIAGLFRKQYAEPVHALVVALDELVVQHYCRTQILRQGEAVE